MKRTRSGRNPRQRRNLAVVAVLASTLSAKATAQPEMPELTIGIIDFYGLKTVTEAQVRAVLPFEEGFVLTPEHGFSEAEKEAEMAAALGVSRVDLTPVCCPTPDTLVVYVGIEEESNTALRFREEPTEDIPFPAAWVELRDRVDVALVDAIRSGDAGDDHSEGHSLPTNPQARELTRGFVEVADENFDDLAEILQRSAHHREIAARILAYATDKQAVVPLLEAAVLDPDPEVRNNAMRALGVLARYATDHREEGLVFRTDLYVDLLNSVESSDRNKGAMVLWALTSNGHEDLRTELRDRALPNLIDMCGWTLEFHASIPCTLLERALGMETDHPFENRDASLARAREVVREINAGGVTERGE